MHKLSIFYLKSFGSEMFSALEYLHRYYLVEHLNPKLKMLQNPKSFPSCQHLEDSGCRLGMLSLCCPWACKVGRGKGTVGAWGGLTIRNL